MRLTLVCVSAREIAQRERCDRHADQDHSQFTRAGQKDVRNKRSSSAKLAVFDATLTYAAIVVGAPS